jgi:hypothetical protein
MGTHPLKVQGKRKYKAKESTSRHKPKKKQEQTINQKIK